MKGKKIRSINFILWLSFLGFAAFIIILTWVFQATLLKTLFSDQFERDINEFGDDVYGVLKAEFRKPSEKPVPSRPGIRTTWPDSEMYSGSRDSVSAAGNKNRACTGRAFHQASRT